MVLPLIGLLVFTAIDLGRLAQYQNRMSNAAREGAAIAQVFPTSVNSGCQGDRNVTDRTQKQSESLSHVVGYSVSIAKKDPGTGSLTPYTGCTAPSGGLTVSPGDHVVVTVTADVKMSGPITTAFVGGTAHLRRRVEVVVQG